jgi:large subunit ribosomal protein L22
MKFAKAKTKNVRISPRKAILAAGLIRGLTVPQATVQLLYSPLKGSKLLRKTLDSAVANAETQLDAIREKLKIHEVLIDEGPTMKRAKPKNRGGRAPIMKRTSHFTIVLLSE